MRTREIHIDDTFATTKQEAENKLKAISGYPEIKERLHEIKIKPSVSGLAYRGGVSCVLPRNRRNELTPNLLGYSAYIIEID